MKLLREAETGGKAAEVPVALAQFKSLSAAKQAALAPYKLEAERFLIETGEQGLDGRSFLESTDAGTLQKMFSIKHVDDAALPETSIVI